MIDTEVPKVLKSHNAASSSAVIISVAFISRTTLLRFQFYRAQSSLALARTH